MPTRLLFVCLGNICRSPSGENVMRHLIEQEELTDEFEIDSAGTASWHIGKRPDSRMTAAAQNRGINMKGRAQQVSPDDFAHFDWIFWMFEIAARIQQHSSFDFVNSAKCTRNKKSRIPTMVGRRVLRKFSICLRMAVPRFSRGGKKTLSHDFICNRS